MGWISVNDEVPNKHSNFTAFSKDVLVTSPTLGVDIGAYYITTDQWFYRGQAWTDITHWMYLPDKPND